ncbi:MAG: isoprenylcysteine carboxyl methyltransferase family protein [Bdellovibrionales bacterium]
MAWGILGFIVVQRLVELGWAQHNTTQLLKRGAREFSPRHYGLIVLLHATWLGALTYRLYRGEVMSVAPVFFWAFVFLTLMRFWVLWSLGSYFTTRIISLPGAPLVRTGLYRFLRHPNYAVVIGEIFIVPLIFGWADIALIWGTANIGLLAYRIRCENEALQIRQ